MDMRTLDGLTIEMDSFNTAPMEMDYVDAPMEMEMEMETETEMEMDDVDAAEQAAFGRISSMGLIAAVAAAGTCPRSLRGVSRLI